MDKFTPQQRHKNMAAIHSKDTKPEMIVQRGLWNHGYTMGRAFEVVELSSICGEQKNR